VKRNVGGEISLNYFLINFGAEKVEPLHSSW